MDKLSRYKLAENEVIFREANSSVAEFIAEGEGPNTKTQVPFYCECSNRKCRIRIKMTPKQYRELHRHTRYFIALAGHEMTEIEKVVQKKKGFNVIEKYGEPPTPEEIDTALERIK